MRERERERGRERGGENRTEEKRRRHMVVPRLQCSL